MDSIHGHLDQVHAINVPLENLVLILMMSQLIVLQALIHHLEKDIAFLALLEQFAQALDYPNFVLSQLLLILTSAQLVLDNVGFGVILNKIVQQPLIRLKMEECVIRVQQDFNVTAQQ